MSISLGEKAASIEEINAYAGAAYRPKPYSGKLILFRSTKRAITEGHDELLGWGGLADLGVEVHGHRCLIPV